MGIMDLVEKKWRENILERGILEYNKKLNKNREY